MSMRRICDFCGEEANSAITLFDDKAEEKRDTCRSCFLKIEALLKSLNVCFYKEPK